MKAMVMAAGLGTRLAPLTDFIPKPMMPIANRPVLHHLLNLLHRHDIREVGINLHAFPDLITTYFGDGSDLDLEIHWSHEHELLGTAGGTKQLEDLWGGETILVTSGDGLHDIDVTALLGHHKRTRALATLAVKPVADPSAYGVVILDRDTRVSGFQEKPRPDEARSNLANCGVYVIEPELLARIPASGAFDFGRDLWPSLVAKRTALRVHDHGVLERRRRPRRAPELDPRRGSRSCARRDPWCRDRARDLDGPGLQHRSVRDARSPRSSSVGTSASGRGPSAGAGGDRRRLRRRGEGGDRRAALLPGSVVPDEGLAIAGIFGDASKLSESIVRYPARRDS